MTKATGTRIEDLDYNLIRNEIVRVLGAGGGKFGYGQPIVSSAVARNSVITSAHWNNLRFDILNARLHQDGVAPDLTQATARTPIAYSTTSPLYQFNEAITTAVANKFNIGAGQFLLQSGTSKTRTTAWSSKLASTVTVTFSTVDQARWFFNSGGEIRFSSSRTGGSLTYQAQNTSWSNLLTTVGTISFKATGFYELTNQYATVYTSPPATPGDFSTNRYQIRAKSNNSNNSNGGATILEFEVTWEDNYTNVSFSGNDAIDGTLILTVDELRAEGSLQPAGQFTIARPSYSMTDILEVGPTYAINANGVTVDESGTVLFNVVTTNVPNNTVLYWTARPISGTLNASDFTDNLLQGTTTITNNASTISRTLKLDALTEGPESFEMILRTNSQAGSIVARSTVVTVRDTSVTPTYSITPTTTSVNEDGSVRFDVVTTGVPEGTRLYWTTSLTTLASSNDIVCISVIDETGATQDADWTTFRNNYPNRPFYLLQPGRRPADLKIPLAFTTDSKAFGPIAVNRDAGSVTNTSDWYTLCNLDQVPNNSKIALSIDTSGSMTKATVQASINLLTSKLSARGITIAELTMSSERYITPFNTPITMPMVVAVTGEDFLDNAIDGYVDVSAGGTASFTRQIREDYRSEGAENFLINLRTGSATGPIVATSSTVTINDTSLTRVYSISTSTTSVYEGNTVTFNVTTSNVRNGTALYWTTTGSGSLAYYPPAITSSSWISFLSTYAVWNDRVGPGITTNYTYAVYFPETATYYFDAAVDDVGSLSLDGVLVVNIPQFNIVYNASRQVERGWHTITITATDIPGGAAGVSARITDSSSNIVWTTRSAYNPNVNASDFTDGTLSGIVTINSNVGTISRPLTMNDGNSTPNSRFRLELRNDSFISPVVATSNEVEIIDDPEDRPPTYSLTANRLSVDENGSVAYTVTTSNVPNNTVLYWTTSGISASDFTDNTLTGTVVINNNLGSIFRTLTPDFITEGTESFTLYLRTASTSGTIVATAQPVAVNDTTKTPSYTVTSDKATVTENESVIFSVSTENVPTGTILYWSTVSMQNDTNASDFTDNTMTGSFVVTNNSATVIRTLVPNDGNSVPNDKFRLQIRTGSITGTVVATSSTVEIIDNPDDLPKTYTVTPSRTTVSEGSSVDFTVNTTNVVNGTTLYWSAHGVSAADFSDGDTNGSFTISSNTGTATVRSISNDALTEGTESFYISIRTGSTSGSIVANSSSVTITDTSTSPPTYALSVSPSTANEGASFTFTVSTTNVPSGTVLYWTASGTVNSNDFTDSAMQGTVVISGNSTTIVRTTVNDLATEGNETFTLSLRTGSTNGTIVATRAVTINDTSSTTGATCISVIDETSVNLTTIRTEWNDFRTNYPNRKFYLLRPDTNTTTVDTKLPAEFKSDPLAFGPIQVSRDNGSVSTRSDWFALCNLGSLPYGAKVAIAIDNSGSMKTKTVQASYDLFTSKCAAAGLTVVVLTMSSEHWATPFNTSI
jgi:hypothetical protein